MNTMSKPFLSCKNATEFVEKKQHEKLTFKEGLQLKLHLMMCKICSAYEKQSLLIGKVLKKHFNTTAGTEDDVIKNEELKERIISKL